MGTASGAPAMQGLSLCPLQMMPQNFQPKELFTREFYYLACISSKISGEAVKLGHCLHGNGCKISSITNLFLFFFVLGTVLRAYSLLCA